MNGNWYIHEQVDRYRHIEDIARAEQYRLALQTLQARPVRLVLRRHFVRRFLYGLGLRLSNWGCRLQSLYE